jgi:oxygen-independent coproporphyrinogen III oxidase
MNLVGINKAKQLARYAITALNRANLHQPERHNVVVPGTPASIEDSARLLYEAVSQTKKVTLYAGFTACPYICRFCRYANIAYSPNSAKMISEGVISEIALRNRNPLPEHTISSVYIGGGTPALFPSDQLEAVLKTMGFHHKLEQGAEVTIETTPEIVTEELIQTLRDLKPWGANRVSMGVQWLNDDWLKSMGRKHSVRDVHRALDIISRNMSNFNIDLMYGFEGQTLEDLARDILTILQHRPTQVTLYRLEQETRTDDHLIKIGRQNSEDVYALQAIGRLILQGHGYIEGPDGWFTAPEAQRAQVYEDRWTEQIPMVAYGPEAYSYSKDQQFTNRGIREWSRILGQGQLPINPTLCYVYDDDQSAHREMAFRLRSTFTTEVVRERQFFKNLEEAGFGVLDNSCFRLNKIGIMTVQEIVRFLVS